MVKPTNLQEEGQLRNGWFTHGHDWDQPGGERRMTMGQRRVGILLAWWWGWSSGFVLHHHHQHCVRVGVERGAGSNQPTEGLLEAIGKFKEATARDGVVPIDFGVKGGELESKDRTPKNLASSGAFYNVSEAVGSSADAVLKAVHELEATESLAADATKFFGTQEGAACPLHGTWQNLWTTAADATFSADSKRGDAFVGNVVDARRGRITNVITFKSRDRKVDQLRVAIRASALTSQRLQLTFLRATVKFRARFLGLFKSLVIPVPAVFLTKLIFAIQRIIFFYKPPKKAPDPPFFDILYLDHDIRVQRTGDGNVFIQKRLPPALAGL